MPRTYYKPDQKKILDYFLIPRDCDIKVIYPDGVMWSADKATTYVGKKYSSWYWDDKMVEVVEMDEEKTYCLVEEV